MKITTILIFAACLLLSACTPPAIINRPAAAQAGAACPVSQTTQAQPPDDPNADTFAQGDYFIDASGSLWVAAPAEDFPWRVGGNKVIWIRPAGQGLQISGERLDGEAAPLHADIPDGYYTGFQVTGLYFPSAGCWQVEANSGEAHLSFVVMVAEAEHPVEETACSRVEDLLESSQAVITAKVLESYPTDEYVWQNLQVRGVWRSPFGPSGIGDRILILQDLREEAVLEGGEQYALFLQYEPWQIACDSGGAFHIQNQEAIPLSQEPLWPGGKLSALQELAGK